MSKPQSGLIYILAAIIALGPLSVDLYLPAMPAMRDFFNTDISQVQLTLSSYLLGFSIFHLLCGPLSDRFGRKPILLGGLALYVVMSVLCAQAESIEQLISYRFFQAMGACCAPTLGRAIVRDVFPPIDAVKALAYVSSIMAIAPVLAPSLGGIVVKYYDWSMTFYVLAGFGVIGILLTAFVLEESVPQRQALHPLNIGRNYLQLLRTPQFMGHLLTASFVYSTMFAFLSGASFILIEFFKVPAEYFGLYFMFIVFGYIVGNLFTAKVAHTWSSQKLYALALSLPLLSTSAMILFAFMHWYEPILFVAPVLFCTMACGLILPKAMAESLKPFAHMAATASALIGFIQMAIASIAGWLVGVFLLDSPMPMAVVMFAASVAALLSYLFFLRPLLQKNTQSLLD